MFAVSFSWAPPKSSKNTIRLSPSVAPWSLIRVGMTESTTCAGPHQWPIHYCCHTSRCGRGRRGGHRDESHKLHQCLADVANFRREKELEKKHQNENHSKRIADIRRIAGALATLFFVDVFFRDACSCCVCVKMGFEWIWCVSPYVQTVACIENIISERNGGYHWKCRSFIEVFLIYRTPSVDGA